MAGHSHSQNVAGRKNAEDKKKAQTFTKFFKEILGAMKVGGPDEEKNTRLKNVLKNAILNEFSYILVPQDLTIRTGLQYSYTIIQFLHKNNDFYRSKDPSLSDVLR